MAFSIPDALICLVGNRCVLSRAKSCTECIRVDKDCSFCTDEVRPCRDAQGSTSHSNHKGIPPPLETWESHLGIVAASGSSFSLRRAELDGKHRSVNFLWCGYKERKGSPGQTCRSCSWWRRPFRSSNPTVNPVLPKFTTEPYLSAPHLHNFAMPPGTVILPLP